MERLPVASMERLHAIAFMTSFPTGGRLAKAAPAASRLFQDQLARFLENRYDEEELDFTMFETDPFTNNCPLFSMLSPHLQLQLLADLARWVLCAGEAPPAELPLAHLAALWAVVEDYIDAHLSEEVHEACELEQAETGLPLHKGAAALSTHDEGELVAETLEQERISWQESNDEIQRMRLQELAALRLASGGGLEELGLQFVPPAAPATTAARAAPPPQAPGDEFAGLTRAGGAAPAALPGAHNRCRRLVCEAWTEAAELVLPPPARRGGRALGCALNADSTNEQALAQMCDSLARRLVGRAAHWL